MSVLEQMTLDELLGRFVADLGATMSAGNVLVGDRLGLYRTLAELGPLTAAELATATGTSERPVREWLRGQAAGRYVSTDSTAETYWLDDAQRLAFADPDGLSLPGAFQLALGCMRSQAEIEESFRTGEGFGWHEHDADVFTGCERFFRPGYVANLVSSWIPAIPGLAERLTAGAKVADVGCGLGTSTRILATTYPAADVVGFDVHAGSVQLARRVAEEAGLADLRFEVARAQDFPGQPYDLVTSFDSLHDMGDPVGAARHIREVLAPDGVWLLVEPYAADDVVDNLTPVGRVYYSFSTFLCVPHAVSEGATDALGSQAGERTTRAVVEAAGFRSLRRAAQTPFNLVYEVRDSA